MKTLYYLNNQWKLANGKMEYTDLYIHDALHYGEKPKEVKMTFDNFQQAIEVFEGNKRPQVRYTLFRKKPYLYFHINGGLDRKKMYRCNFKPFTFRYHVWDCSPLISFKELMEELPADEFVEYCKDHGLSIKGN